MNNLEYCWDILDKVSRSFALCIPKLPENTRDIVCVSYLICRIADTVEDSRLSTERKKQLLDEFKDILLEERIDNLENFSESVAQETPNEHEADLVRNTNIIIKPFSNLLPDIKESVKRWIGEMINGMKEYLGGYIETLKEQDRYCFYVAGTVGNMLTEIFLINKHINKDEYMELLKLAPDFGLGLQKVNIIRNIKVDFEEGRRYWPLILFDDLGINYEDLFKKEKLNSSLEIANELIKDAQQYLNKGLEYILFIPENEIKLRTFCCIPLFMAVATLSKCYNNPNILFSKKDVKISRDQVIDILTKSSKYSQDDSKIVNYFYKLREF